MTVKERLIEFQQSLGISVREFELSINLANGSLKKVKNISGDTLEEVCRKYPNLSAEWLLREEGSMDRLEAAVIEAKGDEPLTPVSEEHIKALINESVEQKLKEAIKQLKA